MAFLRDGIIDVLCLEYLFGNLTKVLPVFNEERIQGKIEGLLFPNSERMDLKVSVLTVSDL